MEKKVLQAHGLTPQQMQDLHQSQAANDDPEMEEGSEDSDYEFPEHEAHLVHAEIEQPEFDPHTGERLSKPRIQKYYPKEFRTMEENNGFAGYKVKVLHDPTEGGTLKDVKRNIAGGQSTGDRHHPDSLKRLKEGDATVTKEEVTKSLTAVGKMTKPDLQKVYKDLHGEDADEALTVADLKKAIKEKAEFLQDDLKD